MALKDTFKQLHELLHQITADLEKSEKGNKAASQRVRTGTVKLEKIAKQYRKESIAFDKKNRGQKKSAPKAATKKKVVAKAPAKAKAPVKGKTTVVKAKPKMKAVKAPVSRQKPVKRATAKLPTKRARH